jgi:3D (Asp-Asp-Asp) domain-containing protein
MKKILMIILFAIISIGDPVIANSQKHNVKVTAYAPVKQCTKSINPNVTASGFVLEQRHSGVIVALSMDLAKRYKFGDQFKLVMADKEYIVYFQDVMHSRKRNSVDVMFFTVKQCKEFGSINGHIEKII